MEESKLIDSDRGRKLNWPIGNYLKGIIEIIIAYILYFYLYYCIKNGILKIL